MCSHNINRLVHQKVSFVQYCLLLGVSFITGSPVVANPHVCRPLHCTINNMHSLSSEYIIYLGLTINFFSTDYDVGEEEGFVTIEMAIREAQIPFTLTLTPITVDDVLADTRFIATDYLAESFSTLSEVGKATPGEEGH